MTKSLCVGFVGVGSQGAPMARRIIDAGFSTTLWARREQALTDYQDTPAATVRTRRELGEASDVLCVCVVNDADVRSVLLSPEGALAGMAPGGIVVIHSTTHPDTCRQLQADFPDLRFLDAPVSGGGARAEAGTLLVMVGGPADVLDQCRPVLETFANPLVHLGRLGVAQEAKLLNNALFTAQLGLAAEVFAIGRERGLDLEGLSAVLRDGSGRSYAAEVVGFAGYDLAPMAESAGSLLGKDVGILAALLSPATSSLVGSADAALNRMGAPRVERTAES
jgi:3-hydroxyisobutyrate dehydrogenase